MSSIGRVNVVVGLDGSEFRRNSQAMAGELRGLQTNLMAGGNGFRAYAREARAMFERNMTPLQSYQRELSKVRLLQAAGAIDAGLAGREMARLADRYRDIIPPVGRFNRMVWEGRNAMRAMAGATAGARMGLGAALGIPLGKLAVPAALGIGTAMAARSAEGFNRAMTSSLAIQPEVDGGMRKRMEAAAFDQGFRRPAFSAAEYAKGFYHLASAGLTAEQQIKSIGVVADFAQAGMFDLAQATDVLTTAQGALGLRSKDAVANMQNMQRVADVLAKADTLSTSTIEQFSLALTHKAGAALKVLGKDVEEGMAALSAFADQGIRGQEAGNALSIVLRDLQTKAIKNADAFAAWGVEVYRMGEMRHLADIIGDMEATLGPLSDETRRAALMQMGFADRSVAATQALLGTSAAMREYYKEYQRANGFINQIADAQLTPLAKGWGQVKNALTELANAGLTEKLNSLGDGLFYVASGLRAWKAAGEGAAGGGGVTGVAGRINMMIFGGSKGIRDIARDVAKREVFGSGALPPGAAAGSGRPAAGGIVGGFGDAGPISEAQQGLKAIREEIRAIMQFGGGGHARELLQFITGGATNQEVGQMQRALQFRDMAQQWAHGALEARAALKAWNDELLNLSERQRAIRDAARNPLIRREEIAAMREWDRALTRKEQLDALKARGRDLTEQFQSPREAFRNKALDLRRLLMAGAIDFPTASRALSSFAMDMNRGRDLPLPRLAEAGTQEARMAILEHQYGGNGRQDMELRQQLDLLRRIAVAVERRRGGQPPQINLLEVDF